MDEHDSMIDRLEDAEFWTDRGANAPSILPAGDAQGTYVESMTFVPRRVD